MQRIAPPRLVQAYKGLGTKAIDDKYLDVRTGTKCVHPLVAMYLFYRQTDYEEIPDNYSGWLISEMVRWIDDTFYFTGFMAGFSARPFRLSPEYKEGYLEGLECREAISKERLFSDVLQVP